MAIGKLQIATLEADPNIRNGPLAWPLAFLLSAFCFLFSPLPAPPIHTAHRLLITNLPITDLRPPITVFHLILFI
jgi:hypothetical protein